MKNIPIEQKTFLAAKCMNNAPQHKMDGLFKLAYKLVATLPLEILPQEGEYTSICGKLRIATTAAENVELVFALPSIKKEFPLGFFAFENYSAKGDDIQCQVRLMVNPLPVRDLTGSVGDFESENPALTLIGDPAKPHSPTILEGDLNSRQAQKLLAAQRMVNGGFSHKKGRAH